MGRRRWQMPSVERHEGKRSYWRVRYWTDVLVAKGHFERRRKSQFLGYCPTTNDPAQRTPRGEITKEEAERERDAFMAKVNEASQKLAALVGVSGQLADEGTRRRSSNLLDAPAVVLRDAPRPGSREERLQKFVSKHDCTIMDVWRSAHVKKTDGKRWRKGIHSDSSVMSVRIEEVLSGQRPLIRNKTPQIKGNPK